MLPGMFNRTASNAGLSTGYTGYAIDQSASLDNATVDYLQFTPGIPTAQDTWSVSLFARRFELGRNQLLLHAGSGATVDTGLLFNSSDQLGWFTNNGSSVSVQSSGVFRDVSSWYHIVGICNGSTVTWYVNGVAVISAAAITNCRINNSGIAHSLGQDLFTSNQSFAGGFADFRFIDGTAQAITDFGEFWSGNDKAWRAILPSGLVYGANGCNLDFSNAADLGEDQSGNGNDWTTNGGPTQSSDSPTKNIATLNPLNFGTYGTLSNGNRTLDGTGAGYPYSAATLASHAGKFYAEIHIDTIGSGGEIGLVELGGDRDLNGVNTSTRMTTHGDTSCIAVTLAGMDIIKQDGDNTEDSVETNSETVTTGDVIGIAWNLDDMEFIVYENGTQVGSINTIPDPVTANAFWTLMFRGHNTLDYTVRFAEDEWDYTPPADHVEISAANLPEVTITDPGEHFNAVLHTGNGTAIGSGGQAITGVGFQPDLTYIKGRSDTDEPTIYDAVRGIQQRIRTSSTAAEDTRAEAVNSFDSDGFTLGSDPDVNGNTDTYVSWNWKAGGSGVANSDGSISSTVSANDDAGFSLVGFTGTGSVGTVGHGQSAAPEAMFFKNRDTTDNWVVYFESQGAGNRATLNATNAFSSSSPSFNSTAPTDSVITVGSSGETNGSTEDIIAMCFRSIPGYSKVFSFEGNGNASGPFVYLGFKARWILIKGTAANDSWVIWDAARNEFNVVDKGLLAESSAVEASTSSYYIDFLSNGFKLRSSWGDINASGDTYIGIAFAEVPFGGSNVPLALAA